METHIPYDPARPDAVIIAHPALKIWILPPGQDILVAHVVGPLVEHPGTTLHSNGVAVTEVSVELWTVSAALIIATLKVSVFIKHNL